MKKRIVLEFTEDQKERLLRFIYYKKLVGDLNPDVNPVDRLAVTVGHLLVTTEPEEK